jgi:hypothetical protein
MWSEFDEFGFMMPNMPCFAFSDKGLRGIVAMQGEKLRHL